MVVQAVLARLEGLAGVELNLSGHLEKGVSAIGGFIGILAVLAISQWAVGWTGLPLIGASMGASAVLVFAVPHGPLSQPWPVIGGHVISAAIGVAVALLVPNALLAAALAVGLAIGAMHYLRCIHPPGGATALNAVIGGAAIEALGFGYVFVPVLLNALIIVIFGVLVNYPFAWRRYPVALHRYLRPIMPERTTWLDDYGHLSREDLTYALKAMDTFIDVTEEDLERIFALATHHAHHDSLGAQDIRLGAYYSNGRFGEQWAVRQVIDESGNRADPELDIVIFKTVAGQGRRSTGMVTRQAFASWARYEVFLNENAWQRIEAVLPASSPIPVDTT